MVHGGEVGADQTLVVQLVDEGQHIPVFFIIIADVIHAVLLVFMGGDQAISGGAIAHFSEGGHVCRVHHERNVDAFDIVLRVNQQIIEFLVGFGHFQAVVFQHIAPVSELLPETVNRVGLKHQGRHVVHFAVQLGDVLAIEGLAVHHSPIVGSVFRQHFFRQFDHQTVIV